MCIAQQIPIADIKYTRDISETMHTIFFTYIYILFQEVFLYNLST